MDSCTIYSIYKCIAILLFELPSCVQGQHLAYLFKLSSAGANVGGDFVRGGVVPERVLQCGVRRRPSLVCKFADLLLLGALVLRYASFLTQRCQQSSLLSLVSR